MVDNCYGEFVDEMEPSDVGADVVVGSLIKNPGGGVALSGGYVVGKKVLIDRIANRLTAPGVGKEIGLTFGTTRNTLQGLFFAPHIVSESLKGALLFGGVYSSLGFEITPTVEEDRSDIIQAIKFNDKNMVIKICEAVQAASPVDGYVSPIPWDMPGYTNQVIMASGAFVSGSSIELSADAPMRPPYIAYIQGGLFYDHVKLGVMLSLEKMMEFNEIKNKIFN
jgi:cystathionine beta-lyase family protein involved in aluminum resistance